MSFETAELFKEVIALLRSYNPSEHHDPVLQSKALTLNAGLKKHGRDVERLNKGLFEDFMIAFRDACGKGKFNKIVSLYFLEVLEIRGANWKSDVQLENYYKNQINALIKNDSDDSKISLKSNSSPPPCSSSSPKENVQRSTSLNINAPEYVPSSASSIASSENDAINELSAVCGEHIITLKGSDLDILNKAKSVLETHFSNVHPKNNHSSKFMVREPFFPGSNITGNEVKNNSQDRRVNFAHTAVKQASKPSAISSTSKIKDQTLIQYTRDQLLDVARAIGSIILPEVTRALEQFPSLARIGDSDYQQLPYDWEEAFSKKGVVLAERNLGSKVDGTRDMNSNVTSYNDLSVNKGRKKNFLEVLKPDSPPMEWNEALGQWVEVGTESHTRE